MYQARQGALRRALASGAWLEPPAWGRTAHDATHSFVVLTVVALLLRRWSPWLSAWALHLLIDIPTHARQAWASRIGWPLLDWHSDGVSWVEWVLRRMRER